MIDKVLLQGFPNIIVGIYNRGAKPLIKSPVGILMFKEETILNLNVLGVS